MSRKSKRLENKSKSKPSSSCDIPISEVCNICHEWGHKDGCDVACNECPNSYHNECLDQQFRNKNFDNCYDLGMQCDNERPPIYFEFGEQIDIVIQENKKKPKKGRSNRESKTKQKTQRRGSTFGGTQFFNKKKYKSFTYCNIQYKIGDDVVVSMDKEHGGWDVGRIIDIFKIVNEPIPTMSIMWFWKAKELNGINTDEMDEDDDVFCHELHLDDKLKTPEKIDALIENELTSKALVVSSSSEYLKEINNDENRDKYHGIYWCTHSYNSETKKKSLLPSGIIKSHQIIGITPAKKKNKNKRKRDRKDKIEEALNAASKALMLSSVPSILPCRESEHDEIEKYLKQQIKCHGQGSGLYISGMPGTGKTATVRQIANELKKLTIKKHGRGRGRGRGKGKNKEILPHFEFIEINAMKLPTPKHIYCELSRKILGKHFAPNTAVKKVEKYFLTKDNDKKIIVLLVDELDYLLTRQQKVIYNLFNWPTIQNAKLVVIGIANTMDLPERLLPRVSSRMGTLRVVFKPYRRDELTSIIKHRLSETKVFTNDAIGYCASAVAGVSGDCRTALQICRRAIDFIQNDIEKNGISHLIKINKNNRKKIHDDEEKIVTLQHLKMAKDSFDQSNDIQIVSTLSIYEKLFLTAMVMYNTRSDGFAGTTENYKQKFDTFIQTRLGDKKMKNLHFRNMLDRLKNMGIITITFDKKEWIEWIKFNIRLEEAAHALKENDICAKILSTLQAI